LLAPRLHNVSPHKFVRLFILRLSQLGDHIIRCAFLAKIDALDLFVHPDRGVADDANGTSGGLTDQITDTFAEALTKTDDTLFLSTLDWFDEEIRDSICQAMAKPLTLLI
jgi:hypothetical protein